MARSEQQLTLPVPIFVDDTAIIGSDAGQVDAEAASLAAFLLFLGVVMKEIKTRYAATFTVVHRALVEFSHPHARVRAV